MKYILSVTSFCAFATSLVAILQGNFPKAMIFLAMAIFQLTVIRELK